MKKPQADSPTALRESLKLFLAVSANEGFELCAVDIRAAFLQSKGLDREVFVEPPKDLKKGNIIWRLKKPLYGLDDASRRFWLKVKEIFKDEGMKTLKGDEAFYFKTEDDKLVGMIITHVDDFTIAGSESFLRRMTERIKKELTISKIERDFFRFTGVDICKNENGT